MPGTLPPEKPEPPGETDDTEPALPPEAENEDAPAPESAAARALIGTLISNRYRVDELIGKGGMGAVYRGEQVHLRKQVAIKVLRAHVQKLPEIVARFEREAVAGAHIEHPNVVSATDFGQLDDGSYFLILAYVEATSLKEVLADGPLPAARVLEIGRQIASALEAVHEKGIVHRDVKPQNILIDTSGQVKLIDFGLAKVRLEHLAQKRGPAAKKAVPLTMAGVIFGTFSYLAPEAALGMDAVDERADLYALGIVLYEMLCKKHPFDGKDRLGLFKLQQIEDPPPLHVRAPEAKVPPEVEAIVMRLIQRDRSLRYSSAAEVIAAIDEATAALARPPESPEPPPEPPAAELPLAPPVAGEEPREARPRAPAVLPRRMLVAALAALVISAAVVLVLKRLYPRAPTPQPIASVEVPPVVPTESESPSASAEAPPSANPDVPLSEADVLRGRLKKAVYVKDWVNGEKAVMALAKLDPKLLSGDDVRSDVVAVAAGVGFNERSDEADELFELLANGLGSDGLDLLFELARGRGATKGGRRALDILAQPKVVARETPALRVTLEFWKGACPVKRALLGRVAADGDSRTLSELVLARSAKCSSKKGVCCLHDDKAAGEATEKLKARLGSQ